MRIEFDSKEELLRVAKGMEEVGACPDELFGVGKLVDCVSMENCRACRKLALEMLSGGAEKWES